MSLTISMIIFLLIISIAFNIFLLLNIKKLEDKVLLNKLRLSNFAIETSILIEESKKLTIDDLKKSSILGAPWEEGEGYIIDRDPHYAFGIKYLFDEKGKLIGWVEVPEIKFRKLDKNGKEVLRSF